MAYIDYFKPEGRERLFKSLASLADKIGSNDDRFGPRFVDMSAVHSRPFVLHSRTHLAVGTGTAAPGHAAS